MNFFLQDPNHLSQSSISSVRTTPKRRRRSTLISTNLRTTPKRSRKRSLSPRVTLRLLSRALLKEQTNEKNDTREPTQINTSSIAQNEIYIDNRKSIEKLEDTVLNKEQQVLEPKRMDQEMYPDAENSLNIDQVAISQDSGESKSIERSISVISSAIALPSSSHTKFSSSPDNTKDDSADSNSEEEYEVASDKLLESAARFLPLQRATLTAAELPTSQIISDVNNQSKILSPEVSLMPASVAITQSPQETIKPKLHDTNETSLVKDLDARAYHKELNKKEIEILGTETLQTKEPVGYGEHGDQITFPSTPPFVERTPPVLQSMKTPTSVSSNESSKNQEKDLILTHGSPLRAGPDNDPFTDNVDDYGINDFGGEDLDRVEFDDNTNENFENNLITLKKENKDQLEEILHEKKEMELNGEVKDSIETDHESFNNSQDNINDGIEKEMELENSEDVTNEIIDNIPIQGVEVTRFNPSSDFDLDESAEDITNSEKAVKKTHENVTTRHRKSSKVFSKAPIEIPGSNINICPSIKYLQSSTTKQICHEDFPHSLTSITQAFIHQLTTDIAVYASHSRGRSKVDVRDILLLFQRQRKVTTEDELLELVDEELGLNDYFEVKEGFKHHGARKSRRQSKLNKLVTHAGPFNDNNDIINEELESD